MKNSTCLRYTQHRAHFSFCGLNRRKFLQCGYGTYWKIHENPTIWKKYRWLFHGFSNESWLWWKIYVDDCFTTIMNTSADFKERCWMLHGSFLCCSQGAIFCSWIPSHPIQPVAALWGICPWRILAWLPGDGKTWEHTYLRMISRYHYTHILMYMHI